MNNFNQRFTTNVRFVGGHFYMPGPHRGVLYNPVRQQFAFVSEDEIDSAATEMHGTPQFTEPQFTKYRVEVTENCNANCSYCIVYQNPVVVGDDHMANRNMSPSLAQRLVDRFNAEIGERGSIMLIGGEPLVNWPAVKIFVEQSQSPVCLYTNGIGISDEIADSIASHRVAVFISLDGSDGDANKLRILNSGKAMLPSVLAGYAKLRDRKVPLAINAVVTDRTVGDMKRHAAYFYEQLGCRAMSLAHPHFTEFAAPTLSMKRYVEGLIELFDYAKKTGIYVDTIAKRLQPIVAGTYRYIACKIAGEQRTFGVDGHEILCTKIHANAKTSTITREEIIATLPLHSKYCHQRCVGEGSCGGGCYFDAGVLAKEAPADERECMITIRLVERILEDMVHEHHIHGLTSRDDFAQLYGPMLVAFNQEARAATTVA